MFDSSSTKNAEILNNKMDQLISMETDIKCRLQREEMQPGKKCKREVDHWLTCVERKKRVVHCIAEKFKSASLPDFVTSLATKAQIITTEVEELLEQGCRFSELVLDDVELLKGVQLIAPELKDQTSKMILDKIQDCLFDEDVPRVGIYGVGGVGKTTLAMHINNQFLLKLVSRSPFDHVYWITVSKETSLYKLQEDISKAMRFGLYKFDDEKIRASLLFMELTKRKPCLIILDDVWGNISMDEVGVPITKGACKLLITTRIKSVCDAMLCKTIKMTSLPEKEAWHLFVDQLINYDALSDGTKEIAKLVAKECDGLPLGIQVMATCMRGVEDIHEWRDTLKNMRESTSPFDEVQDKVFRVLHFSYTQLKDEKLQKCFLYCALHPEDHHIKVADLIDCFRAEKLIDITGTISEQNDQCCTILNRLSRACLLEHFPDYYRMHDLVRDMAIGIMKETGAIIKAGRLLKEIPSEDFWTNGLTRVSMMKNNITCIEPLAPPNCPSLTCFLLYNNPLRSISKSFFQHMMSLKILNLSHTPIAALPDSVSELRKLGALILRFCTKLKYIPSLAKLENLLDLILCGSNSIEELPEGVEHLVKLRLFDLDGCNRLGSFTVGLFSRLPNLMYLALPRILEVDPVELVMLKHLKGFEGRFYGLDDFNLYVKSTNFDQLEHYNIQVGDFTRPNRVFNAADCWSYDSTWVFRGSKIINFCWYSASASPCKGPFLLPNNIVNIDIREFPSCTYPRPRGLESARLNDVAKLEYFFEPQFKTPSCALFRNLQEIRVSRCSRIDALFSVDLLERHLPNLMLVFVDGCREMKEVFPIGRGNGQQCEGGSKHVVTLDNSITLPKLKEVHLVRLPSLMIICKKTMICNSLDTVEISGCTNLRRIPISIQSDDRNPCFIVDERSWWDSCLWNDPFSKQKTKVFGL